MATTWTPIASVVQTTIPNDITGNSLAVAPVSGDNNPVTIKLGNGTSTLFAVDAAGKLSASASAIAGNEAVGGTLGVTGATTLSSTLAVSGATTLAAVTSTGSTVNGNETVSGSLSVSGNTSLSGLTATSSTINGNESVTGTLNVGGLLTASGKLSTTTIAAANGTTALPAYAYTSNTDTGAYLKTASTSAAVLGLSVNATDAMTLTKTGVSVPGALAVTGTATANIFGALALGAATTPVVYSTQTATTGIYFTATPAMVFTANGTAVASVNATSMNVAQTLNAQSNLAVTGTSSFAAAVGVTGTLTATNVTLSSGGGGKLTFADGTSQTTAGAASNYTATGNGTTALPVFTYSANTDTGAYLKTASTTAAVLGLSVNATDAMTLTKTGVAVPGTLGVTGTATTGNLTLASGGKVTFADGTTQTTAASSGAAGSAATFTATSNGTVSAPAHTFTNNTDTGLYLNTASTTAAVAALSVNATNVITMQKTQVTMNVPTVFSANVVHSTTTTLGGVTTFNANLSGAAGTRVIAGQGSVTAPAFADSNAGNMGPFYQGSGSSSTYNIGVNGNNVTQTTPTAFSVTGNANVSGNLTCSSQTTTTSFVATDNGTASATQYGASGRATGLYVNTSSTATAGLSAGGTAALVATPTLVTIPLATTHSATVTSTTAVGTASFVSSQGFKQNLMATFWNSTYTAGTSSQMQLAVVNNGNNSAIGSTPYVYTFPYAGSVIALNFAQAGPIGGTNTFAVYKNGSSVATYNSTATSAATTYSKGTYAFAAGDVLTLFHSNNASGNTQVVLHVTIEQGA